jgi:hypothetical protein
MRADRVALALLLAACPACQGANLILGDGRAADSGNAGNTSIPPAADSGTDSAQPISTEFEPPRVIAELESEDVSDDDPSLTADLLVLCFNSKRAGSLGEEDIWCSRRARTDEPWGAPEAQVALNTEHRETGIALSLDGLSVWFSSDRGSDGLDVYTATRTTREAGWSEPTRVPELSTTDDELVSSVDETGLRLMLARRMRSTDDDDEDAGDYDILLSVRPAQSAPWQPPTPVSELNTDDGESDAFLVGTGVNVIFTRKDDLMLAQRPSADAPFANIAPLRALNSEQRERDAWSNRAFNYIVFSSDRAGSFRLYESRAVTKP